MNCFPIRPSILAACLLAGAFPARAAADNDADRAALAKEILADQSLRDVRQMARKLLQSGLTAGTSYGEVWIRDLNTFIEVALEVNEPKRFRDAFLTFFKFQGPDGNIVDGYIPKDRANVGYKYRSSPLAPALLAHKNTVETDQEASLVQAIRKYVDVTGDHAILNETVDGRRVRERLGDALQYVLKERFDLVHGLVWGATTADWGDVQPEHPWGVELDDSSHRAIDIYDNAMVVIAIEDYLRLIGEAAPEAARWKSVRDELKQNVRKHLWDANRQKFIPHLYLAGSPFPKDFDESAVFYHGGTAVAIEAGLLTREETARSLDQMRADVRQAGAGSIGLTLYPPYPQGSFKGSGMAPYHYQNGGDWCWFGGRMIQQLIRLDFIEDAYRELKPMVERTKRVGDFHEWWDRDNRPRGSAQFRGSAGVLGRAIEMIEAWAEQNQGTSAAGSQEGGAIAGKYRAVFTSPPNKLPSPCSTDAPLLGNGDLMVALGGAPDKLCFHLGKADLWELRTDGGPRPLARLEVDIPALKGATYGVTQDLRAAITTGVFKQGDATLTLESAVAATENLLLVKISTQGGPFDGQARLVLPNGKPATAEAGAQVAERRFEKDMLRPAGAACAVRVLGRQDNRFAVTPDHPVYLVAAVSGLANTADYRADAVRRAAIATEKSLAALREAHQRWWDEFWNKSFVEIPDKVLEQRFYLSNYCLGSASRLEHFPPALYGWVTDDEQQWGGAYFNNYNFFAPFYGAYAGNHIEQALPCNGPILDFLESGREWCRKDCNLETGIVLPVSMLPWGITGAPTTWHQRSNASYACVPLASTWRATRDLEFASKAYPFVREVANFWEQRLTLEDGRYVDRHDAAIEECNWDKEESKDVNPLVALALIRQVMNLAADLSTALGTDAGRRAKWTDIRDRMSAYPACTVRDLPADSRIELPRTPETLALPIFRYTEQGQAWQNDNAVGIQHIFPGNGIGLDSPPELLARARNQITVMARWLDFNGCNSFYPAAARVGYDPEIILHKLRHWVDTASPNGLRADNPHAMEQLSVMPCTIQEMLFQSYDGVLRFFPCWPAGQDARFGSLRATGAFLVSAERKGGVVTGVKITSEKGGACTVQNPWPGQSIRLTRNGQTAETLAGQRVSFATAAGEAIALAPGGE